MKNWQRLRSAEKRTSVRGKKKEVSISTLEMEAVFEEQPRQKGFGQADPGQKVH